MDELDSNDKLLLERALAKLEQAQAVMTFLSEHFRDKYHLTSQDQISPVGEIIHYQTKLFDKSLEDMVSDNTHT